MIDDEVDQFLEHFGVKGMRWGVRKQVSTTTPRRKNTAKDYAKVAAGSFVASMVLARSGHLSAAGVTSSVAAVSGAITVGKLLIEAGR